MAGIEKILTQMQTSPNNVRFVDLLKICTEYFGQQRNTSGSHIVFKTPWKGDPRINLQRDGNKAKAYQVKQVLQAITKMNAS